MLHIDETPVRKPFTVSVRQTSHDLVVELADEYKTNVSRIVEALILQYGPKLLNEIRQVNSQEETA